MVQITSNSSHNGVHAFRALRIDSALCPSAGYFMHPAISDNLFHLSAIHNGSLGGLMVPMRLPVGLQSCSMSSGASGTCCSGWVGSQTIRGHRSPDVRSHACMHDLELYDVRPS